MMNQPLVVRSGPTPIYQQLKAWIRQQIDLGVWPEHYQLNSETDLAEEWGVSRGTVRKAVTNLVAEGLLVRIHGRGTFVASAMLEQPLAERLVAFSEELISKGIPYETAVLDSRVGPAPPAFAQLLHLRPQDPVFQLKRLRTVGDKPLILLHNYIDYARCPGIEAVDFGRMRLFQVLEEEYGLLLDWGTRYFRAEAAASEVAALLDLAECDPVMRLEQLVYLDSGRPIEVSDAWISGDRFRLSATVHRDGSLEPSTTWLSETG